MQTYLCLKSLYWILLGKPFLQILMPSSTPLHLSWWMTKKFSMRPSYRIRDLLCYARQRLHVQSKENQSKS